MNILILAFCNDKTGWGHIYRAFALYDAAKDMGHNPYILTDVSLSHKRRYMKIADDRDTFFDIVSKISPDWLISDLPWYYFDYNYVFDVPFPVCAIEGIHSYVEDRADIIISHIFSGKYQVPKYLILRREIRNHEPDKRNGVFIFGGGNKDSRKSLESLSLLLKEDLCFPSLSDSLDEDGNIFNVMSRCQKACVTLGMIVWELVYFGIPAYVFSIDEIHLGLALEMSKRGYVKAYPEIGFPREEEFVSFLKEPFELTEKVSDGLGAERVIKLIENY